MSGNNRRPGWIADEYNLESREEKDEFVRGIFLAQIWGYVVGYTPEEHGDFLREALENDHIAEEFDKAITGESHAFGRAVCDEYAIPVKMYGNRTVMGRKYQRRYEKAIRDSGIEPSTAEQILAFVTLGILGDSGGGDE